VKIVHGSISSTVVCHRPTILKREQQNPSLHNNNGGVSCVCTKDFLVVIPPFLYSGLSTLKVV
jgi:hypothetical protein